MSGIRSPDAVAEEAVPEKAKTWLLGETDRLLAGIDARDRSVFAPGLLLFQIRGLGLRKGFAQPHFLRHLGCRRPSAEAAVRRDPRGDH